MRTGLNCTRREKGHRPTPTPTDLRAYRKQQPSSQSKKKKRITLSNKDTKEEISPGRNNNSFTSPRLSHQPTNNRTDYNNYPNQNRAYSFKNNPRRPAALLIHISYYEIEPTDAALKNDTSGACHLIRVKEQADEQRAS